jgi:hypothetical protein
VSRRTLFPVAVLLATALLLTGCGGKSNANAPVSAPAQTQTQPAGPGAQASTAPGVDAAACPTSNAKNFAKTRFVLHTAEGFGAFHRYLYKPFKAGTFAKGSKGRILSFVKAGAAALFVKRQIRLATEDVKANPTLCKLIAAPLAKIGDTISGAVSKLKGGDVSGIEQANTSISSIETTAGSNGAAVNEASSPNLNG